MKSSLQLAWILLVPLLISCSNGEQEVKRYIKQVQTETTKSLKPLPQLKEYKPVEYELAHLKSPFVKHRDVDVANEQTGVLPNNAVTNTRTKEFLEKYSLEELKMVGTLSRGQRIWGLVKDPDNIMHRVEVGNYIGKNMGIITEITNQRIMVKEFINEGGSSGFNRVSSLSLEEKTE